MTSNPTHKATTALATITTHWAASENPPRRLPIAGRTPPKSKPPAPQAVLRADITTTLAYWTHALASHDPDTLNAYSHDYPLDVSNPRATAGHLTDHIHTINDWGYLPQFTREVTGLAAQLLELVAPPDADRPALGPCHLLADGETPTQSKAHQAAPRCDGTVRAIPVRDVKTGRTTYTEASCNRCRTVAVIGWWRDQWSPRTKLVSTTGLVDALARQGIRVKPATVRWWLHTGRVYSSGTDEKGDRLWDVPAVVMALNLHDQRRRAGTVGGEGTAMPETQPAKVGQ